MSKFQIKGHEFTLPRVYTPDHFLTQGEAEILNKLVTKTLRESVTSGQIKTRAEAEAWVLSPAALGPTSTHEPGLDLDLSEIDEML